MLRKKNGLVAQLRQWFGRIGFAIVGLGGYSTEPMERKIRNHVAIQDRPAILIYAGDHDPSGRDLYDNFKFQTDCWEKVHHVAVNPAQIEKYGLLENPGEEKDPRAGEFTRKYGKLTQVEVDALDPNVLRNCYQRVIGRYWDNDAYERMKAREAAEREELRGMVNDLFSRLEL